MHETVHKCCPLAEHPYSVRDLSQSLIPVAVSVYSDAVVHGSRPVCAVSGSAVLSPDVTPPEAS